MIEVSGKEERENMFKEVMSKNFQNLKKKENIKVRKGQVFTVKFTPKTS
jgi:hypothetical protein